MDFVETSQHIRSTEWPSWLTLNNLLNCHTSNRNCIIEAPRSRPINPLISDEAVSKMVDVSRFNIAASFGLFYVGRRAMLQNVFLETFSSESISHTESIELAVAFERQDAKTPCT